MVSACNARTRNSRRLSRVIPEVFGSLTPSGTSEHEKSDCCRLCGSLFQLLGTETSPAVLPRFFLGQGKVGCCLPGLLLEQWEGQRPWGACFHSTPKSSSQGNPSGIQAQALFGCCSLTIWNPVVFIQVFPSPIPLSWAFLHRWSCVSERNLLESLSTDDKGLLHPK